MLKRYKVFLFIAVTFVLCLQTGICAEQVKDVIYNPPFELYGVVKAVNQDCLEVYIPYIDKQITIMVFPETIILNRMDENTNHYRLNQIKIEDLVIIKGILEENHFWGKEICFLSVSP